MNIAIIGSGYAQEALTYAANELGITVYSLTPSTLETLAEEIHSVADHINVVTYIPNAITLEQYDMLCDEKPVFPAFDSLLSTTDLFYEKMSFKEQDIPTAPFVEVRSKEDILLAARELGFPLLLASRREKEEVILNHETDIPHAWNALEHTTLLLEKKLPAEEKISLIAVRNGRGDRAYYPLTHTDSQGKLYEDEHHLQQDAELYAQVLMDKWNHVGVLTLHFLVSEGRLLAHRVSSGVEESGDWTLHSAVISHYSNHIRAVCNLSLGSTVVLPDAIETT